MLAPDEEALNSIATSLSTIAKSAGGGDWVPTLVSALVAFATTIITAQVTMRSVRKPQREREVAQSKQLHAMLRDEVTLRWRGQIEPALAGILTMDPYTQVIRMAEVSLTLEDLPILKCIRQKFFEIYFIGDPAFVSSAVYASVLLHDVVDLKGWALGLLKRAQDEPYLLEAACPSHLDEWRRYQGGVTDFCTKFGNDFANLKKVLNELVPVSDL